MHDLLTTKHGPVLRTFGQKGMKSQSLTLLTKKSYVLWVSTLSSFGYCFVN